MVIHPRKEESRWHAHHARGERDADGSQASVETLPVLATILRAARCLGPQLEGHLETLRQELAAVTVPTKVRHRRGIKQG